MSTLADKLVEVLAEGGARKHPILLALAKSLGYTEAAFKATVRELKRRRRIRQFMRYGGIHYELNESKV